MIDHSLLQNAQSLGLLRHVDLTIVDFIERHQNQPANRLPVAIALAVALISRQSAQGHVCIDLQQMYAAPHTLLGINEASWVAETAQEDKQALLKQLQSLFVDTSMPQWLVQWQQCEAVSWVPDSNSADRAADSPLVVDSRSGRPLLFMHRYWHNEQRIYHFVMQQCRNTLPVPPAARHFLAQLFPEPASKADLAPDWQKIAVAIAIRQGFSIITGGPGTGKTTTVLKLLCLLQALRLEKQQPAWQIALTAPTGKAASRLNESIGSNLATITIPTSQAFNRHRLLASIPTHATTLHRLLGSRPDSRHFRHHENNPIRADIVVVDEASMIDLDTMAALVRALPKHARLIIIGDKDQLASVEAGSVLGDLCNHLANNGTHGHYGTATLTAIEQITGYRLADEFHDAEDSAIAQATCMLRQSHRFQANGAIARLAQLINTDNTSVATSTQTKSDQTTVASFLDLISTEQQTAVAESRLPQLQAFYQPDDPSSTMLPTVLEAIITGYQGWLSLAADLPELATHDQTTQQAAQQMQRRQTAWAKQVLQARNQFQVLVTVNEGPYGLHAVNNLIEQTLDKAQLIDKNLLGANHTANDIRTNHASGQTWYHGRPIIVVRNDYSLNLMNGDMGICLRYLDPKTHQTRLRVLFSDGKGGIRWVLPGRLRYVETAFAMTVHKSQGSEFDHAMLMLPNRSNPVLSKALMYTGVTRAKQCFSLVYGNHHVLEETMTNGVERASGLSYLLSLPIRP